MLTNSDESKTITNNVPRLLIDAYELTTKEREDFDYLDWQAIDAGEASATFFRYRGSLYDLGEFMSTRGGGMFGGHLPEDSPLMKWDGYFSDSFFSSVVVRFDPEDSDRIIVGMILS
jgi:hypothetical protein